MCLVWYIGIPLNIRALRYWQVVFLSVKINNWIFSINKVLYTARATAQLDHSQSEPNYCRLGYNAKQIGRGSNVLKEHADYLSRLIITSEALVLSTNPARRHIRQGLSSWRTAKLHSFKFPMQPYCRHSKYLLWTSITRCFWIIQKTRSMLSYQLTCLSDHTRFFFTTNNSAVNSNQTLATK